MKALRLIGIVIYAAVLPPFPVGYVLLFVVAFLVDHPLTDLEVYLLYAGVFCSNLTWYFFGTHPIGREQIQVPEPAAGSALIRRRLSR